MNKTSLKKLKKRELLDLATKNKVAFTSKNTKDDLIESILAKIESKPKRASAKKATGSLSVKKRKNNFKKARVSIKKTTVKSTLSDDTKNINLKCQVCPSGYSFEHQTDSVDSLPHSYNITKLTLILRDPNWAYAYWDFDDSKEKELNGLFLKREDLRPVIRVYEITGVNFDGSTCNDFWDIDIDLNSRSWYINVGEPGKVFVADLGLVDSEGDFTFIVRSNMLNAPLHKPSNVIDEQWSISNFYQLYSNLLGNLNHQSSQEVLKDKHFPTNEMFDLPTSKMPSSPSSKVGAFSDNFYADESGHVRDFFLEVNAELIVYGRTKPDATLYFDGNKVKLRKDGSFSFRFHYPDGKRSLPIKAISSDNLDTREVTINVKKDTY